MRIDRYLSENTHLSRSVSKKRLAEGRVQINNKIVKTANTKVRELQDIIQLDGILIEPRKELYIMMHKPPGFISATKDGSQPTVTDLLSDATRFIGSEKDFQHLGRQSLQIVGRLDIDTSGLLLLTTDGQWNHLITSPNSECKKTYRASLAEPLSHEAITELQNGVLLKNEEKITRPSSIEMQSADTCLITISEGRYHQVKRMFAAVGNRVTQLHRHKIGRLELDNNLKPGWFRLLSQTETALFKPNT